MPSEGQRHWIGFVAVSFLAHAVALAWLDLTDADYSGQRPSRLSVVIASSGDGDAAQRFEAAAATGAQDPVSHRQAPVAIPTSTEATKEFPRPPEPTAAGKHVVKASIKPPEVVLRVKNVSKMHKPIPPMIKPDEPPPRAAVIAKGARASVEKLYREPSSSATAGQSAMRIDRPSAADPFDGGTAARRGELLSLLHEAVSREKRYPMLALRQRREGTATVSFSLSPDGEMDGIGIDQSSGFRALDTAAVSAVRRVAPFAPAQLFLSDVTRFKVDVTFKLN